MSEMVERVARALCVAEGESPDGVGPPIRYDPRTGYAYPTADIAIPRWMCYRKSARAAIEAMREPPAAMLLLASLDRRGLPHSDQWKAMIDAALAP